MNWDQIEGKWAAMTLRIRADLAGERIGPTPSSNLCRKDSDVVGSVPAEVQNGAQKGTTELLTEPT